MAIELAPLAGTLVTQILIPYAKKGLERIRSDVGDTAGEAVAGGVEKVWNRVKALLQRGTPREQARWEDFEEYPEDNARNIERTLVERLEAEPDEAEELQRLVNTPIPQAGGVSLSEVMARDVVVGVVNAPHATVHGTMAGVILGGSRSPEPDPPPQEGSGIGGRPPAGDGPPQSSGGPGAQE